jgi:SPP1 family predicted phage head-tail adaptor
MNAGEKRHVITIQKRADTQGPTGEQTLSWTDVAQRWASIDATPGNELWSSAERHARIPTLFKIRYPRDFTISPKMRVLYNGNVFDIVSAIDKDGLKVEMQLFCELLVGDTP